MSRTFRRLSLFAALIASSLVSGSAYAQSATPEGTVITNTATASYTDANGNTYSNVTATSSVTVGFTASVSVTSPAIVTPASPSTGGSIVFTASNLGNGNDTLQVTSVTPASGITITGYVYGSTTYPTLAALNTAISTVSVASAGSYTITVQYNVAAGKGGLTLPVAMVIHSVRTTTATSSATTNIEPPLQQSVVVTPDGGTFDRLPSNGTQYSQVFNISNTGNASDSYSLTASAGSDITIVSVNGVTGVNGGNVTVGSAGNTNFTVVYTVNGGASAGATDSLKVLGTSTSNSAISDPGFVLVRVVKAALTITKQAYKDDQATLINSTTDRVLPGQFIQYKITVSSSGLADAQSVSVSDPLPSQVTYQSNTPDTTGWTISESAGTVTANLAGTMAPSTSRFFWIRVQVK